MSRFIKFFPSETSDQLLTKHPFAFILLCVIATRARRTPDSPEGLGVAEAYLGDWNSYGMTRQNYRTALKLLVSRKYLKILETNRNRKKSTTGITTAGTKVKLLNSDIWDINLQDDNHRLNHCLTTDQPLPNHEQECKNDKNEKKKEKINKKEKSPEIPKISFRDNVTLTKEEHSKLLVLHGQSLLSSMLDILDSYKGSNEKTYKSDYSVMKPGGWVVTKAKEVPHSHSKNNSTDRSTKDKSGNVILSYAEEKGLF